MISRRRFITLSGGLLLTLGEAAAQLAKTLPKIGVLRPLPPNEPYYQAFLLGLRELGYVEGKTMLIEYRHGESARFAGMAEELARLNVNVIFAPNPQGAQAARKATTT